MKSSVVVMLTVLILISITPTASAGLSTIITAGIEGSFISAADNIFNMSFSGYSQDAGNETVGYIYNVASYTPDPMEFKITQEFINFSKLIYDKLYRILLIFAFIAALIIHFRPNFAQSFSELTGINMGTKTNVFIQTAWNGIIYLIFMYTFIFLVFMINDMLTKAVMISILDVVSPTPDNFILYFMMAIAYLIMGFFFSIRTLVIFLFCGFAFLISFLLLVEFTKDTAIGICTYFVQAVFFQFVIVLYFSACILIIKEIVLPDDTEGLQVMYTIMILGGVFLGIKMMFGTKVIRWVGNKTAYLV